MEDSNENPSENIDKLAAILAQRPDDNCLNLYKDIKNTSEETVTVKSVVLKVVKQIANLQRPQNVKPIKKMPQEATKLRNSAFLPLNVLQEQILPSNQKERSDVPNPAPGNVEPLPTCFGVTQEFETTFQQDDEEEEEGSPIYDKPANENEKFEIIDISLKEPDINKILNSTNPKSDIGFSTKDDVISSKRDTQFDDNGTQILNECIEIENVDQIDIFMEDTNTEVVVNTQDSIKEPLSPVFCVKSKKSRSSSSSPLVFNLENFEKFEQLAQPVVEMTIDTHKAKQLINSQIIESELYIQTELRPYLYVDDQGSPIIEISKDEFRIDSPLLSLIDKKAKIETKNENEVKNEDGTLNKENPDIISPKHNNVEEDEILFSSDEENDTASKSFQDLPFTCALETSFYDEDDVLDKTMYVGFQTASNKSILVKTDSFSKAKSLLDAVSESFAKTASITELVEIQDKHKEEINECAVNNTKNSVDDGINERYENSELKTESIVINTEAFEDLVLEAYKTDSKQVHESNTATHNDVQLAIKSSEDSINNANEKLDVNMLTNMTNSGSVKMDKIHEKFFSELDILETNNLDDEIMQEFLEEMLQTQTDDNFTSKNVDNSEPLNQIKQNNEATSSNDGKNVNSQQVRGKSIENEKASERKSISTDTKINLNEQYKPEPMCLDVDLNNIGFITASNKKINVSEKALSKVKNVFQDFYVSNTTDTAFINTDTKQTHCGLKAAKAKLAGFKAISLIDKFQNKAKDIPRNYVNSIQKTDKNVSIDNVTNSCDVNRELEVTIDKNIDHDDINDKVDEEPPLYGFTQTEEEMRLLREVFDKTQSIFEKLVNDKDNIRSWRPGDSLVENQEKDKNEETDYDVTDSKCQILEGFKTASNKRITVPAESLEKSNKLFQEVFNRVTSNEPKITSNNEQRFQGFQTASNKHIKISEKSLARTRKIFENINIESKTDDKYNIEKHADFPERCNDNISQEKLLKKTFSEISIEHQNGGFRTSSNKKIKLSENAVEKSRKVFQDIIADPQDVDEEKNEPGAVFSGFQTANNKKVEISKAALEKSRKLFQDVNDKVRVKESPNVDQMHSNFKGFQTASHKPIKVSEKALEKSKKLFQDFADNNVKATANTCEEFKGFHTASNKPVNVSKTTLEKGRKLFQDIHDNEKDYDFSKNITDIAFKGFQTASNKEVKISAKALERTKKIFQNIDDEICEERLSRKAGNSSNFMAFKTANDKHVNISEEALEKSKKLFQESATSNFKGFQTASNKEVKISAKALERTKKIFQNIDDKIFKGQEDNKSKFVGFQTANNKQVNICKEALEKSKNLFKDLDNESATKNFIGFQTASNKEVKISAEALAKSMKIFENIDDNEITKPISPTVKTTGGFKGFQTANHKEIHVLKSALEQSKKIFQEMSDCHSVNNKLNPHKLLEMHAKNQEVLQIPNTSQIVAGNKKLSANLKEKFGFITGNNNKVDISEKSLLESKKIFAKLEKKVEEKIDFLVKNVVRNDNELFDINTEVLNDFESTFKESTPKTNKRSGSPILSCPKAKKRKVFKIPYSQKTTTEKEDSYNLKHTELKTNIPKNKTIDFRENYKKQKVYTLKDLAKLESDSNLSPNTDLYILKFDFVNLLNFEFCDERNDITESNLTITELKNIFANSVNKKLIPDGWLDMQLKLIIWKLISYEIKYPKTMSLTLTAKNVLQQLKFRYDKELYNAERPILRKILERDDVSTKSMVLCVVDIVKGEDASALQELLLTDGWYIIKAVTDKMLAKLIGQDKIKVGTKLFIQGAELVGSEQAVSPWEDTKSIRLKIHGNSTRRARWDARLGCHGNAAILARLSNVTVEGGKVPKVRVFVTRVYPPLYVDKFEDGSTVTRSERLEHLYQMKYESERQIMLDKIYEEVEKEIDQDSEDSECSMTSGRKRKIYDTGSQVAKIVKRDGEFQSQLTSSQRQYVEEYNNKKREKILSAIQEKVQNKMAAYGLNVNRNVVTVLKIRIVDVDEKLDSCVVTKAMLSIWRPNEAILEVIKENSWIEISNVTPTAFRYSELQLSASRQSIFNQSKHKESDRVKPYTLSLKRKCYPIKVLVKNPTTITNYNEIDTVGIVINTEPSPKEFDANKQMFQDVYLADIDKNIISINFWGGLKKFGFENCLDTGQIVAGINLQRRAGNTKKSIPHYRVTEFSYFTKTPKNELARELIDAFREKLLKLNLKDFVQECCKIKDDFSKKHGNDVTPYRSLNINMNCSKYRAFLKTPAGQNIQDDNLNLTGLDFESTFKQKETQDLSPKTLLRKQQVKQKIAKLKMYGEPPALSPIQIINKSKNAAKAYKSPLISKSDVSNNVASNEENLPNRKEDKEEDNLDCSPVICLNRTYVKRCEPKPVQLNFSKNDASYGDDFAEEFDCSPPLSLD